MDKPLKQIVILGGGSAGWLTAGVLASEHNSAREDGVQITLVESPSVSTVGVGEGTWPTMRNTLRKIGISENTFIRSCDASFKQGSQFVGWVDGKDDDKYYHPFTIPTGLGDANIVQYWRSHQRNMSFANAFTPQAHVCDSGLAPKQKATPEYAVVVNYGYHLDAGKFAQLLERHCTKNLGVKHLKAHVTDVRVCKQSGFLESILTDGGEVEGDFFIDCSGFASLLLGQHYKIPFIDKQSCLFNDSALAARLEYPYPDSDIATHTISTAKSNGWVWDIGLPSRRGIGYVYSSDYTTDEDAEKVLREYIGNDKVESSIRKISFKPGHREKFWHKNCVAVGMAAGFLEPLEASALALIELSASMISKELPARLDIMDLAAKRFNKRFHYRWEKIIDFLKLHYVLSKRDDSQYWIDNRDVSSISDTLLDMLKIWKYQVPSHNDFTDVEELFSSSSYQYILYGMDFNTEGRLTSSRDMEPQLAEKYFLQNQTLTDKYLKGLPKNRDLINYIFSNGMPSTV